MPEAGLKRTTDSETHRANEDAARIGRLNDQETRHWYLLAAISIISTAGLAFAAYPILSQRMADVWPWANTNLVLLIGLMLSILMLVGYLTLQQRTARTVRIQVQNMMQDSSRRARQNTARMHALLNVSRMMGSVTNLENVFNSITSTSLEIFDCQQATLMLLNEKTNELETRAVTGHLQGEQVKHATQKVGEGIAGWVAETTEPLILTRDTDPSQYPNLKLKNLSISAAMVVPILLRDELVGVLNISSRAPDAYYTDEDLQALQVFAENAGTCIRHTEHVEWMRQTIQNLQQEHSSGSQHEKVHDIEHSNEPS
ncbi:MAG: GAF domain-containing protein [Candidatus Krumholzibacteria bacterium]